MGADQPANTSGKPAQRTKKANQGDGRNSTGGRTVGSKKRAPSAGGVTKSSTSRSYPRGVGLDFRKLAGLTLLGYIDHHGVQVRPEAPPSELAVAVARHFETMEVDEEECIGGFLERLEKGHMLQTDYARETAFFDGREYSQAQRKRRRSKWAARQGEQVAAKVTRTDENGSWILASVQRFYPDTETYDVQDEDDTSKLIRLPWSHVMRLSTGTEGCFQKDTDCMAIFPETTSFYRSKVSKSPVWKLDRSGTPMVKEIIVKFEDDEDAQGRTPHRRVPSRYVIPIPQEYFYDETDDVDLTPPTAK
uniref:SGF29 C-terminal domain-containing protein n=1 Tax=Entomoneis paludosa TaxID=265537 RepID=A0A7S2YU48_9STRA|mmetsp:Transcript_9918/g.20496  ORF Transcript_9918/g.20496 Transcript_9918/m.20496 type:complete len:305 (+) Transcript_9918:138-1052(+)